MMVWSVVGQGNPQSPATPACTPSPSRETDTTKKKQAENAKPPRPQGCRGFCGNSSGAPGLWHKTPGGKGRPECKEEPQALYLRGSFPPAPRCTPVSPAAALDQRPPQASGHHRTVAIIGQCTSHQWLSQVSVHHTSGHRRPAAIVESGTSTRNASDAKWARQSTSPTGRSNGGDTVMRVARHCSLSAERAPASAQRTEGGTAGRLASRPASRPACRAPGRCLSPTHPPRPTRSRGHPSLGDAGTSHKRSQTPRFSL